MAAALASFSQNLAGTFAGDRQQCGRFAPALRSRRCRPAARSAGGARVLPDAIARAAARAAARARRAGFPPLRGSQPARLAFFRMPGPCGRSRGRSPLATAPRGPSRRRSGTSRGASAVWWLAGSWAGSWRPRSGRQVLVRWRVDHVPRLRHPALRTVWLRRRGLRRRLLARALLPPHSDLPSPLAPPAPLQSPFPCLNFLSILVVKIIGRGPRYL